jgi:hypothetical protein
MHGSAYDLATKGPGSADPEPFAFAVERGLELAMQKIAEASV